MSTTPATTTSAILKKEPHKAEWTPHMWIGCDFFAWLRMLFRNRCAVHPRYWYVAVIVTFLSFFHTLLRGVQGIIYGRKVRASQLPHPPLFIIGHWRTGTTWLHELLTLDDRHTFPSTYECMAPNHFLLTEGLFPKLFPFLVPRHRPMDNMKAGFQRPQEDEFALCMLGVPSPYLTIAFPNHPPQYPEYLDLEQVPPRDRQRWKNMLHQFLLEVNYRRPGRLILKSPPHTARLKILQELYPDALFVHIVRDPYVVFPSTVNLWRKLYESQAFQRATCAGLEDHVFETGLRLYEALEKARASVDPRRFYELRYEDLVRDPLGQMQALYEHLGLGEFEKVRPKLEEYLAGLKGYETNRYNITPELRERIRQRWGSIIQRYGYDRKEETGQPTAVAG